MTGASGWIGTAATNELLAAGHTVVGLARSDASAASLAARGIEVLPGGLDDLEVLRQGAHAADAVVHLANKHDWANPAESNRAERAAVETMLATLEGTGKPFALASGLLRPEGGRPALESDSSGEVGPQSARGGTENLALDYAERGVRSIALRFAPTVHGVGDHGFVAYLVAVARRTGVSGYVGSGEHSWAAVHRSDAGRLVRLALEQAPAGSRVHAVGEPAVPTRLIAEAIAESLGLATTSIDPADATGHFGFLGRFFGANVTASSEATRATYDWTPTGPTLLEDLAGGAYLG